MAGASAITWERRDTADGSVVTFAGRLNERAELADLAQQLRSAAGPVVFDLGAVSSINSVGVMRWLRFLRELGHGQPGGGDGGDAVPLVFRACSPAVTTQIRTIRGFAGRAMVESFQVTYACGDCQRTRTGTWRAGEHYRAGGWFTRPEVRCEGCRSPMELVDSDAELRAIVSALGH